MSLVMSIDDQVYIFYEKDLHISMILMDVPVEPRFPVGTESVQFFFSRVLIIN